MIPSANPLTIQEDTQLEVRCVVNSNAAPAPTITWYLESANITSIAVTNTTFITLTGNRTNNNKTLQCRATNNNNKPPKTANTTLNVECKFILNKCQRNLNCACLAHWRYVYINNEWILKKLKFLRIIYKCDEMSVFYKLTYQIDTWKNWLVKIK